MKHLFKVLFSSIFFLSCSSPTLEKKLSDVNAYPAMWLVTNEQSKVYILGSIHVLPPNVKWYSPSIEEAFENSEVLFVESLQDEMTDERYMAITRDYGVLPDGGKISDYLTQKEYTVYLALAEELRLERDAADRMKPWFFLMILDAVLNEDTRHYGVDTLLEQEAIKRGKVLKSMESVQEALLSLASSSLTNDIEKLKSVLNQDSADKEEEEKQLNLLIAWIEGDTRNSAHIIEVSMTPQEYDNLIIKRNHKWHPKVIQVLNSGKTTMIVVGLAHLVGKGNIIDKLKRSGYKVKRVQ